MQLRHLLARLPPPLQSLARTRRKSADYESVTVISHNLGEPNLEERRIPERFIHDIWRSRLFDAGRLCTSEGASISVIDPGEQNLDSGPDFRNARIRIGELDWRGDVEIHFRSSDWIAHEHQFDPRYNSVVLHVTFLADFWTGRLARPDGTVMPEVVLKSAIAMPLHRLLVLLNAQRHSLLPCEGQFASVPAEIKSGWITRLSHERLEEKADLFGKLLVETRSVDDLLYRELMRGMGFSKNADAFYELACRVSLRVLRECGSRDTAEAILFGAAGLTSAVEKSGRAAAEEDDYQACLRRQFVALNHVLDISAMSPLSWTFFRLRPTNFPTIRIAQAAGWFDKDGLLRTGTSARILEASRSDRPLAALRETLSTTPSSYWATHYRFGRHSKETPRSLGSSRIDSLIENVVLPFLLQHSQSHREPALASKTWKIASLLPVESTETTRRFATLGFDSKSGSDSRGLHQLYRTRCANSGCLGCPIGRHILRSNASRIVSGLADKSTSSEQH